MSHKLRTTKTGSETSIQLGHLYFEDVKQCAVDSDVFREMIDEPYVTTIRLMSLTYTWTVGQWVTLTDKVVDTVNVEMTLRSEVRSGRKYWYAYRRVFGKLNKRYVRQAVTIARNTGTNTATISSRRRI